MTRFDLVVIGAGPAGMAAAVTAREAGLSVLLVDEQTEPGGQIWRAVERNKRDRPANFSFLGEDYAAGAVLAGRFRSCGAEYWPSAMVCRPISAVRCLRISMCCSSPPASMPPTSVRVTRRTNI